MSEKFQHIVNAPHMAVGKLGKKIKDTTPKKMFGKVARGTGITTAATAQALLWLAKYITLDNHITRGGEKLFSEIKVGKNKNGADKKFPKFIKKNPNFTSIVSWWMLLASLGIGGSKFVQSRDGAGNIDDDKIENIDLKYEDKTLGGYCEKIKPVTPFLIASLVANEGVRVNEDGLHVVYDDATGKPLRPGQKPKGRATIGFGSTVLKDGTSVTSYTKPITTEEAYELARWHLEEGETYFGMYCYDTAFNSINIDSVPEALAIASIMYNGFSNLIEPQFINKKRNRQLNDRFADLRQAYKDKGAGLSEEDVLDAFAKNPVDTTYSFGKMWLGGKSKKAVANTLGNFCREGRGLWIRRWVEAGLLTGDLTPDVLLKCPIDGLSAFLKYKQKDVKNKNTDKSAFWKKDVNGNTIVNKATYAEFLQWLENPVNEYGQSIAGWKKVRDYMPDFALVECDKNICELKPVIKSVKEKQIEKSTYVMNYENLYADAVKVYKSGDYETAFMLFENLAEEYPDNALLHNDLAATCNHLGRYEEAIFHAQEIVKRIGDKSQYAAAQYNAGFAYEQLGNLNKALANYKLAVANGNRSVQSDVTRVTNLLKKNTKQTSQKIAFNDGAARIKKKATQKTTMANVKNGASRA
ncbi:MAG: tetratricopeptide repeat protein [Alphaproteobacteria bacterium]|nr:tetratricopeptide repeat protein [Alphaproteobacteria bacterium]